MAAKKKIEKEIPLSKSLPKNEDGSLKWRDVVSKHNILLNRQTFAAKGIDVEQLTEDEISRLKDESPDKDVMISLGGFREIAAKRGFKSVNYTLLSHSHESAVFKCSIEFTPTEEEPFGVLFDAVGTANVLNTESNFVKFLENIAEIRAFGRCVRNFFRIESLGWDEVRHDEKVEVAKITSGKPLEALKKKMETRNVNLGQLKDIVERRGYAWNEAWESEESIPVANIFTFISLLNENQ